jgi:hypothetical protein
MATQRRRTAASIVETLPAPAPEAMPAAPMYFAPPDEDVEPESASDRISRMLGEVSDDSRAKVALYRVDRTGETPRLAWLQDYPASMFESGGLGMVRDKWGAGEYEVRIYGAVPGKAGKPGYGLVGARRVHIEADPQASHAAPPAAASAPGGQLERAIEAMLVSQQQFQQTLMQALTQRPDPKAELKDLVSLAVTMREAFGVGQAAPNAAAPPQRSTISELVEAIKELRGAADLVSPPEPAERDELMQLLPTVLETIKSLAAARPAPLALPAAAPTAPPAQASLPHIHEPTEEDMLQNIRTALAPLLDMAAQGKPVDDGVAYVCDHLPDEAADLMEDAKAVELLVSFMPAASPHAAWLEQVRQAWVALPIEPDSGTVNDSDEQSQNDA